ncbi:MAG: hypothetical protein K6T78_07050 [Alicyclobacillus sp.]|nr:hypothetical protein [Alicyclobacillus sp.]
MDEQKRDSGGTRRTVHRRVAAAVIIVLALAFVLLEVQEFLHLNFGHFYFGQGGQTP